MEFAEINGAGLRYELSGKGGKTLVLVHEMGGSLESWDEVAPPFAETRQVLRYDCRGAGLSQKVRGELALDTMADDIAALLDHNAIAGKVALAGIAVGGAIALHFAARHPQRTSAVAVGSPATGIAASRRVAVLERVAQIEAGGMAVAVEESMRNGYPAELRGDVKRFERYRARWLGNDPASYATIYRMLAHAAMADELAKLACPVLVIGGSLVHPSAGARESRGKRDSRRNLRGNPHRPLHGSADARPHLRSRQRLPARGRQLSSLPAHDLLGKFSGSCARHLTPPKGVPTWLRNPFSRSPAFIIARSAISSSPPSATAISTAAST
jgi:3-oxoadipate enol-lactonase